MKSVVTKSQRCGSLSCGREHKLDANNCLPCDWTLLDNHDARCAAYRVFSLNGSRFLCCEECRQKFERNVGLRFERLAS